MMEDVLVSFSTPPEAADSISAGVLCVPNPPRLDAEALLPTDFGGDTQNVSIRFSHCPVHRR